MDGGPSPKRARKIINEGNPAQIQSLRDLYLKQWSSFKLVIQYLTLEEINVLCQSQEFHSKCKKDTIVKAIKAQKLREYLPQILPKFQYGNVPIDGRVDDLISLQLESVFGHVVLVNIGAVLDRFTDDFDHLRYRAFWASFTYLPNNDRTASVDFNVYRWIFQNFSKQPEFDGADMEISYNDDQNSPVGVELMYTAINERFRNDNSLSHQFFIDRLYDIIQFIFERGFVTVTVQYVHEDIQSCISCGQPAQFKTDSPTKKQYYCSEKCYYK